MERRVEELLNTLHGLAFTDAETIIDEIRAIVLSPNLPTASIAFFSSKLLNSEVSLLQFILKFRTDSDRLIWKTMSNALSLVSEYIRERGSWITEYVTDIKEACLQLMASSTKSSMVKEAALRPLLRLLEVFTPNKVKKSLDPRELLEILLDNKLRYEERTMGSTLKGAIFNMLGLLISNFENELADRAGELQRLMLIKLKEELYKGAKTEEKSLAGLLKGLASALKVFNYDHNELKEIFSFVRALLTPLQTGRYTVCKASMKLLSENSAIFKDFLSANAIEVMRTLFELNKISNTSVKYLSEETAEKCLSVLSDTLQEMKDITTFEYILKILTFQINSKSSEVLHCTIRYIGVFSQAISKLKGEDYLKSLLDTIISLGARVITTEDSSEDFKSMLLSQKKLASLLIAYSDIAMNMIFIPESALFHFSEIAIEIFRRNYRLFKKYRKKIYNALALLLASLYTHTDTFVPWVRVFIVKAMRQLLQIPEDLEDVSYRIDLAGKLWAGIFEQPCLNEGALRILADEIGRYYHQLVLTLDLTYEAASGSTTATSPEDQQLFFQASEFGKTFLPKISLRLQSWVMPLLTLLSKKISELPLLPALYMLAKVVLDICSLSEYCNSDPQSKGFILNMIKAVIKKMQGFQDLLLTVCIQMCLAVPVCVVYSDQNNLCVFESVLLQALTLGLSHPPLAHTTISMLNTWRKLIPMRVLEEILPRVLPALSPYITLDKLSHGPEAAKDNQKTIAFRVVKFLGSLGGASHFLVNTQHSDLHLAWDTQPRLRMQIRFNQNYLELNLDQILPRVIHLAEKSSDAKTKISACELLHALVIFMIGKRTQVDYSFARIYQNVFPSVYRLAVDVEVVTRQLFEPLAKQLVRWFAKSFGYEHGETMALLDALIEGVCSSSNSGLRNLAAESIGEFCRYVVLYNPEPFANFKSTFRRVEALSNHPQADKRKGAILCFRKILPSLSLNDQLIDRFLLEFTHIAFVILRLVHSDKSSEGIIEVFKTNLVDLKMLLESKIQVLMISNDKRTYHRNVHELIAWLWELCKRPERLCRQFAQEYWKSLSLASAFDIGRWKAGKNPGVELRVAIQDFASLAGVLDFYLWTAECGIFNWNGSELSKFIVEFIAAEKDDDVICEALRTYLVILRFVKYYPQDCINDELLMNLMISPHEVGVYMQAESQEYAGLYDEVAGQAFEILMNIGFKAEKVLQVWQKVTVDNERMLKFALKGMKMLVNSSNAVKNNVIGKIYEGLNRSMMDYLASENSASVRKGKIILEFLTGTQVTAETLKYLLRTQKLLQITSDILFYYMSVNIERSLELFFDSFPGKPAQLLSLCVPLLERCRKSIENHELSMTDFVRCFIKQSVPMFSMLALVPTAEFSLGVIKIYSIFLDFVKDLSVFNEGVEVLKKFEFFDHLKIILTRFISLNQPITVKKESFRLLALTWDFTKEVLQGVKPQLIELQSTYFISSTQEIIASKESNESDSILKAFFELFLRIPHLNTLELIYPWLREEASKYESELKYAVDQLLKQEIVNNFEESFAKMINLFLDPGCDKGIVDNLRWGLCKRVIIPMIDFPDEALSENLMIAHTGTLIRRLTDQKFTEIYDSKDYLFALREKTGILLIFERFFAKIPATRLKEQVHKSLYGTSSQGNELTKQLISFCTKYRRERPEKYELIDSITNNSVYIRNFCCAAYACLLTCVRKTQSQEKVYVNFLFRDQNWKLLIEDKENFDFKPQTTFITKDKKVLEPENSHRKISNIYISSSLFSQDVSALKATEKLQPEPKESPIVLDLEPDELNSIIIMRPLLEVIEKIDSLFPTTLEMPQWMQCLNSDLQTATNPLSVKLFIVKILLNRPQSFQAWANQWLSTICSIMAGSNGGIGFHYFLRDVSTMFLFEWPDTIIQGKERDLSRFLNHLIKVSADTNKDILESNLNIIQQLIQRWKVSIEHKYIEGMIKKPIKDEDNKAAIAWRICGICIYGFAIDAGVKILSDGRENPQVLDEGLLKCLDINRRHIVLAAAEVIGKRLRTSQELLVMLTSTLAKRENKEIGIFVSVIERVSRFYPQILDDKTICFRLSACLNSLSGNSRGSLLLAIHNYSEYIKTCVAFNNLPDLMESLHRDREKVSNDNEDSHRLALLKLLYSLLDLVANPSVKKAVSAYVPLLKSFSGAKNSEIRRNLYSVMQKAYDDSKNLEDPLRVRSKTREVLLKGLSDADHSDSIMKFWDHQDHLSLDPHLRMLQCLSEIYTPECEELWLVASSHLIVRLTQLSTDYERILFDHPLSDCDFRSIQVKSEEYSSLPMTPMFSPSYFHQESLKRSQQSSQFALPYKSSRIRHNAEGSQASLEEKREKIVKAQMERLEQRLIEQKQRQNSVTRTYRNGELPDIQIKTSDILAPLNNLILLDCEIASNIWVGICTALFIQLNPVQKQKTIQALNRVLELTENYNPDIIACIHRTTRELILRNGEFSRDVKPKLIEASGIRAMCYQSAILLLQDCLMRFDTGVLRFEAKSGCERPKINADTKDFWVALTRIYEKMGDVDSVKGLWMQIFEEPHARSEKIVQIRRALDKKSSGELVEAISEYRDLLTQTEKELQHVIHNEYLDSLAYLGKWADVKENSPNMNGLKIKSYFRLNEFAELTEIVKTLPQKSLYIRYPYEMSLLNITQDDLDRARYYLDQDFSRFVEKWQSLNPLSYLARHKLVQRLQKIYELSEFLSLYRVDRDESNEELLERVQLVFSGWKERNLSMALDDLSTWEEVLYARVLFYDKIQARVELEGHEMREFASLLYAGTAECPLKLGWLEVSERYLRDSLNKRHDKTRTSTDILSPILRLKAKKIMRNSEELDTDGLLTQFNYLFQSLNNHRANAEDLDQVKLLYGQLYKYQTKALIGKQGNDGKALANSSKEAYLYLSQANGAKNSTLKFAKFCDLMLRNYEEDKNKMGKCFEEMKVNSEVLARTIIRCALESMKFGSCRAHDMFPRLISLLKYPNTSLIFKTELKTLPEWMLIRWIGQILSIFHLPECDVFTDSMRVLVTNHPQVLYYPFKTFTSIDSFATFQKIKKGFKSQTWVIVEEALQKCGFLDEFTESLDQLTYPEHRIRSYVELLKDAIQQKSSQDYIEFISQEMLKNLLHSPYSGVYNKKFANDWTSVLTKIFGRDLKNPISLGLNELNHLIDQMISKIPIQLLGIGKEKLSSFSEWLADYGMDQYTNTAINIPGLASGMSQPLKSSEVKIVSFDQSILILASGRRPKRIGIHGSDEKEYLMLVKGGEDMRLDQRIQQIFNVMNRVFFEEPECAKLSIKLKTFSIVPITKRLGILEWVSGTEPLKAIINNELQKHYGIEDIEKTHAIQDRLSWLKSVTLNPTNDKAKAHLAALKESPANIIKNFKDHESKIYWDLIRQGLLSLSTTPESYMHLRKQFIHSLAAISIAGYILGLGDRHLENFLLDKTDGGMMAIDFGVSFGQGLWLSIPELMPFRMTRQLMCVLAPEGINGELRHTMIHCLKALRKHKNVVLDCCEVFVNEPLLDWVKGSSNRSAVEGAGLIQNRLEVVRKKLNGGNSAYIMLGELLNTRHANSEYTQELSEVVLGPIGSLRRSNREDNLPVDTQVDILLEHATDPNILGRTWIGWSPMI